MPDNQWGGGSWGDSPSGGPGQGPDVQGTGSFSVGNVFLSSDDFGTTLNIQVKEPNGAEGTLGSAWRVYYLSPLDVGDGSIIFDTSVPKLSKQFVVDIPQEANQGVTVPYTPIGTNGGRRDYSLGGWMFASPILNSGAVDVNTATSLVRVPTFDKNVSPANSPLSLLAATITGPTQGIYTVALSFRNPQPIFGTTQYAQVWMYNYFADARYRNMGIYRLHGAPGETGATLVNGQTVTYRLEPDGGGHAVSLYVGHLNGQRSYPFGKVINTFLAYTIAGGFP